MKLVVVPDGLPDKDANKVYWMEERLRKGHRFRNIGEAQRYARYILSDEEWFKADYPFVREIMVKQIKGTTAYGQLDGWTARISLPEGFLNQLYFLHELAHCCQPYFSSNHGEEFREEYLYLVEKLMGLAAADRMRRVFRSLTS